MTINELIIDLLKSSDLGNQAIADKVLQQFPNAKTTAKSVASVASVARKYGVDIKKRPTTSPTDEVNKLKREVKVLKYLLQRKERVAA
jgi:hypothetical protein